MATTPGAPTGRTGMVQHQIRSFQSRGFRRRVRMTSPDGWRHLPANLPAAMRVLAKEIVEVSREAEKILFRRVGENPIGFLAHLRGDVFREAPDATKYLTGSHIGRIVFVRWLRVLQPFS